MQELGWKRSDVVLTTKIFWGGDGPNDIGLSRKHIIEGTRASLKRLQTDYVGACLCVRVCMSALLLVLPPPRAVASCCRRQQKRASLSRPLLNGRQAPLSPLNKQTQQNHNHHHQKNNKDLIFAHRPDDATPIEETVRAFNFVLDQGWALYWGTSEWSKEQIEAAWEVAERLGLRGPEFEQPQYNVFERSKVEREFAPLYVAKSRGLGLTTWSPLASGVLTGKYSQGVVPPGSRLTVDNYARLKDSFLGEKRWQIEAADALAPIAAQLGCSLAQLALAWCLKNGRVSTVIMGATSVEQLRDNLGALQVAPKLGDNVMARIEQAVEALRPPPPPAAATVE
jgi:aryl-alcohol dehydrogenase-like predicted oxidoreductase